MRNGTGYYRAGECARCWLPRLPDVSYSHGVSHTRPPGRQMNVPALGYRSSLTVWSACECTKRLAIYRGPLTPHIAEVFPHTRPPGRQMSAPGASLPRLPDASRSRSASLTRPPGPQVSVPGVWLPRLPGVSHSQSASVSDDVYGRVFFNVNNLSNGSSVPPILTHGNSNASITSKFNRTYFGA